MIKVFLKKDKTTYFEINEEDASTFIAEASQKYYVSDKIVEGARVLNLTPKKAIKSLKEAIDLL